MQESSDGKGRMQAGREEEEEEVVFTRGERKASRQENKTAATSGPGKNNTVNGYTQRLP